MRIDIAMAEYELFWWTGRWFELNKWRENGACWFVNKEWGFINNLNSSLDLREIIFHAVSLGK